MGVDVAAALIALAAFAAGAAQPLLSAWLLRAICRWRGHRGPDMLAVLGAMLLSLGACSAALVGLALLERAPGFAISIPFVLGLGAARLARREL